MFAPGSRLHRAVRNAGLIAAVAGVVLLGAGQAEARRGSRTKAMWAKQAPKKVRIDGIPKEWDGEWRNVGFPVVGSEPASMDLRARVIINYDKKNVYLAADVRDEKLVARGDHVELLMGIPGGRLRSIRLYPGVPGKSRAQAKTASGHAIRGAKIVEAPVQGGYTLEAQIPWSAFPETRQVRIGLRAGVFVHDADGSKRVETVIGTAPAKGYGSLPALSTEPEIGLLTGLIREKKVRRGPQYNLLGNVVGGRMKERVLVYNPYLVIMGWDYRGGWQYFYRDVGYVPEKGPAPRCELHDLTGDGRQDILLRKWIRKGKEWVQILEVLSFHDGGDVPESIFDHETAFKTKRGMIRNDVRVVPAGKGSRITIRSGRAKGLSHRTFRRSFRTDADDLLLPWGTVASRTYAFRGGEFTKINEKKRAGGHDTPTAPNPGPTASPPTNGGGSSGGGTKANPYGAYKREHGARGKARFKLSSNLIGSRTAERVVLHGRDLVAYGSGFHGGKAYAMVTLSPFRRSSDITSIKARDVTGDGKSEILVTGVMRGQAPAEAGGGEVARKVVLIYKLTSSALRRIFAAEIEFRMGSDKVVGSIRYGRGSIELRPGRAVGFDESTYPFEQEVGSSGGFEPLLLPWSGARPVRYRFDGSRFRPQ